MKEPYIVMRWQNAESMTSHYNMRIEVFPDGFRLLNDGNPSFAKDANWFFNTLDGVIGWCNGVDVGRMMK